MHSEQAVAADERVSTLELRLAGRAADSQRALEYARACFPEGTDREHRLLALHLAAMFALDDALEFGPPLASAADEQRTFLPWTDPPRSAEGAQALHSRAPVRAAIEYVERQLAATASADRAVRWWRKQGELMVAAVWEEARWRSSGILPDDDSYLAVAEVSIGIPWIVASLLLLDGARLAPMPDGTVVTATAALAAAIRVANDLHETRRERREGKVQLLFLRKRALQALGYPARSAERRARQQLQAMLEQRVTRARALLVDADWSASPRLRSGLDGMLSTALHLIHMHESAAARTMTAAGQARK